ncbi:MAG: glycosyltransferase family 9 protein [Endomicrobiales bacterium]
MHIIRNDDSFMDRLGKPLPRSVVILRALQLGDLLCAVPAFRALRAALPDARIALVGLPWAAAFVARFNRYLDDFIEFPGYPGLPERLPQLSEIPSFIARVQREQFDLALQMHGSGSFVNPLTGLFGARRCAGFYVKGEYCPDSERFLPYPDDLPETERNLHLVEFLGVPSRGPRLEFPVTRKDREELLSIDGTEELKPNAYVCLHTGARFPTRRWLPARFAAVADRLACRGFRVVLTGSAEETALARAVGRAMSSPALNLCGLTSTGALAALLQDARLLISNDTGVTHIADALGIPRVVIVTGSDPLRWQPPGRDERLRTVFHPVDCRPCTFLRCPLGYPCARKVGTGQVLAQAEELLAREEAYAV